MSESKVKRMLIIDIVEGKIDEMNFQNLLVHAEFYRVEVDQERVKNISEFQQALNSGSEYNYLILMGHGDEECFTDGKIFEVEWTDIGQIICNSGCLVEGSILMMYCCKGGVMEVAYTLFAECDQLSYIFGCKEDMWEMESAIGFSLFLYNHLYKDISPEISAEKVKEATDKLFVCYSKNEVISNPHWHYNYCKHCENTDKGEADIKDCPNCP